MLILVGVETVFLVFRQKSSTDYINLATLLGNTTV